MLSKFLADLTANLLGRSISWTKQFLAFQLTMAKRDISINKQRDEVLKAADRTQELIAKKRPKNEVEKSTKELINAARIFITDY